MKLDRALRMSIHNMRYYRVLCMVFPAFSLLLLIALFTACSEATNTEENSVSLDKISWCNKQPTMVFMDDRVPTTSTTPVQGANTNTLGIATGTPVALKNWHMLKMYLGFVVFLPTELPSGSCLLSASGSVRNAVSGSNFALTYLLPDQTSLTIAQSPQRVKNSVFQCSAMPDLPSSSAESNASPQAHGTTVSNVEFCTGTHKTTNITFSANWNQQKLAQFFQNLQPNVNWMPPS
jgi:hypothetical protein